MAVGSYSISQSVRGTSQNIIFKTLRQIGRPAPLCKLLSHILTHENSHLLLAKEPRKHAGYRQTHGYVEGKQKRRELQESESLEIGKAPGSW